MASAPLKVLLELRPAFDGHAGIPQEARLLFRGLRLLEGLEVEGLMQSSGHVLAKGLPARPGSAPLAHDRALNRLSRVVVSSRHAVGNAYLAGFAMAIRRLLGGTEELTRFDPAHFRDFVWQALFARTLHPADFDSVTTAGFRVARVPWTAMHRCALLTRRLGGPLYPRLDTTGTDVMIAETPYPARVSDGTRLVVRYHDAIPILMPHTIDDMAYHQASHYHALRLNVESGAHFACVSEATRRDLVSIFPQAAERSVVIPNMVSHHYFAEDTTPERVPEILRTRVNAQLRVEAGVDEVEAKRAPAIPDDQGGDYLLMVSTIEPRKNHAALLAAWEHLRAGAYPGLRLVLVGMLGWGHKAIAKKLRPWLERGALVALEDVPAAELRLLYRHARATVCPSFGEGFDFSGIEAMRCECPVVASDIAVHREVFGSAAEYFSPYSTPELVSALAATLDPARPERREALRREGAQLSQRYLPDKILPQWRDYLLGARPA